VLSGEAQSRGFDLAALFQAADELGLRYVGYSEHWHRDASPDLFRRIRDEVERLQARHAVKVYLSAEIDVLNSRGDLACDLELAAGLLDYVSVAISHYGAPGSEQLLADRVDDTVRMIEAVCALPQVTLLMHPQIAYGRSLDWLSAPVPADVYDHVLRGIAASGKVVDFPSLQMNVDWLSELYGPDKLAIEQASFQAFARAVVAQAVGWPLARTATMPGGVAAPSVGSATTPPPGTCSRASAIARSSFGGGQGARALRRWPFTRLAHRLRGRRSTRQPLAAPGDFSVTRTCNNAST
jgi:hypothetical protein